MLFGEILAQYWAGGCCCPTKAQYKISLFNYIILSPRYYKMWIKSVIISYNIIGNNIKINPANTDTISQHFKWSINVIKKIRVFN